MVLHTLNSRVRIQILMQRQLEHRTPPVPRNDNRAHEEVCPNPVPLLSVRFDHVVLVGDPVIVPPEESSGVMDAEDVDVLDFEPSTFDLGYDPRESARGVSTGEDPSVHVETPGRDEQNCQILPPRLT